MSSDIIMTIENIKTDGAATTLPSALDIARERSQLDSTPTTSTFLRRLRSGERAPYGEPLPQLLDGKQVVVTPQTVEAIVFNCGDEVCSKEEAERLRDLEAEMLAILKKAEEFGPSKVGDYVNSQRAALHAAMEAGEDVAKLSVDSREHVALDFRAKQSGFINLLNRLTTEEVVPLAKPILQRFAGMVEDFLRSTEEGDRCMCAGFGLEYQPSYLWKAATTVAQQYLPDRRLPSGFTFALPSSVLAGLVNFNK
jgi:hypothetical protein